MLDLDLRPGTGLGLFELGASLWSVLDVLRRNNTLFPRVDLKYDPDASAATPILLHIHPHLDLLFSGYQQRLYKICLKRLRDLSPPVTLRYKDLVLSSNTATLRRSDVSRHFGPTYAGEGLQYPGVSFLFEDDNINETMKGGSTSKEDRQREVKRVIVCQTLPEHINPSHDVYEEIEENSSMTGSLQRAIIKVHDGVKFKLYPSTSEQIHVQIGTTSAQDLICDLGAPLRIYYKEDDRMSIHSRNKPSSDLSDGGYFYNYFQYGVDFLINGSTHLVQKIILHTNIPGTSTFQRYHRCPWEIEGDPEDEEDDTPPRVKFYEKFDVISRFLNRGSREQVPSMQLDRAEDERLVLPSAMTRLFGFDGVVLEVTESAQVTTIVLF